MPKPMVTPLGSHPFSTSGSSPGAYQARMIASVRPISMNDARDIATGTARRVRSRISLGRAHAGRRALIDA